DVGFSKRKFKCADFGKLATTLVELKAMSGSYVVPLKEGKVKLAELDAGFMTAWADACAALKKEKDLKTALKVSGPELQLKIAWSGKGGTPRAELAASKLEGLTGKLRRLEPTPDGKGDVRTAADWAEAMRAEPENLKKQAAALMEKGEKGAAPKDAWTF